MIYKCTNSCGVVWTRVETGQMVDPTKVDSQTCPDCIDFEWVSYNRRVAAAALSLGKPKKV